MRKVYEAFGQRKRDIIDLENDYSAFHRERCYTEFIDIKEIVMVGRITKPSLYVNTHWNLNGLIKDDNREKRIVVIDSFALHVFDKSLSNISENDTYFNEPIKLSEDAIVLMPVDEYDKLCKDPNIQEKLDKMNVRLYEGEEELALKMIFYDKRNIYLEMTKEGYVLDNDEHIDAHKYTQKLIKTQEQIVKELQKEGRNVTYKNQKKVDLNNEIIEKQVEYDTENVVIKKAENNRKPKENIINENCKMITGLTKNVEGDINVGKDLYAATDIGKTRKNQEDAVLLIRDNENPQFKMMVVADGMGGWSHGEVASNTIINRLKEWFENLSKQEKINAYNDISTLQENLSDTILMEIQSAVKWDTLGIGGSTLVCSIVGKNNTLVANIGDSRAYIAKGKTLEQVSREDTVAQEHLEKGKTPSKEASRFDEDSNQLTQCLGMNRKDLKYPHVKILDNRDYDMILLFSDGVTDCLSDEDIAVVCRNTDKKKLANKIVEKALSHDSFSPDELDDYVGFNCYIPGGKDNTTAAVYAPKKDNDEMEK